jgi:hypothetical protein
LDKDNADRKKGEEPSMLKNPYTMEPFNDNIVRVIRLRIAIDKAKNIALEFEKAKQTPKSKFESMVFSMFQEIDKLGNYTNHKWFMDLSLEKLYSLYYWCKDIWEYSYQGTKQERMNIIPPTGRIFTDPITVIKMIKNVDTARSYIFNEVRRLVLTGISRDDRAMGSWLFLSALTKVSQEAADAMPHLATQIME